MAQSFKKELVLQIPAKIATQNGKKKFDMEELLEKLSSLPDKFNQAIELLSRNADQTVPAEDISSYNNHIDFFKLQGGIYKMLNGEYALVRGFGEDTGWGFNLSTFSDILYTWDTENGACIYRGGAESFDRRFDLIEYLGTDLGVVPDFTKK